MLRDFIGGMWTTMKEQYEWFRFRSIWSRIAFTVLALPLALWLVVYHPLIAALVASCVVSVFIIEPLRRLLNLGPVLGSLLDIFGMVGSALVFWHVAEVTVIIVAFSLVMDVDSLLRAVSEGWAYVKSIWNDPEPVQLTEDWVEVES
jgi:hypothetical protein